MPNKVQASVVHGAEDGGNSVTGNLGIQNIQLSWTVFYKSFFVLFKEEASSINNTKWCIVKHGKLLQMCTILWKKVSEEM